MHHAQAFHIGEQPADAGSGGGTGCLIGISDQDDAITLAILGDGDVGEPARDTVDDFEIAECVEQPGKRFDECFARAVAQRLDPWIGVLPENKEIGAGNTAGREKVQVVDPVGDPLAVIGQRRMLEGACARRADIEAESSDWR
ncbi:hypothetical protein AU467_00235 [Mesorhizobium loti]|uniref:Uncharacterized protein n=1 Tax=Rhizobium loti TaxID=381 RepID=A0A101KXG7_RHILI|nr:hypothetical protein AU467_00235 [Mesorhizobium loti]